MAASLSSFPALKKLCSKSSKYNAFSCLYGKKGGKHNALYCIEFPDVDSGKGRTFFSPKWVPSGQVVQTSFSLVPPTDTPLSFLRRPCLSTPLSGSCSCRGSRSGIHEDGANWSHAVLRATRWLQKKQIIVDLWSPWQHWRVSSRADVWSESGFPEFSLTTWPTAPLAPWMTVATTESHGRFSE